MHYTQVRENHQRQQGVMTLRAVLLLFTGSLILVLLVVSMTFTFSRFRDYISGQLEGHARDAATAVGLSLSNAIDGRDAVASASLIDSVFDSGRYLQILYLNHQGNIIAGRQESLDELPVPGWFVALAELPASAGEAEVMRGWQRLGRVRVVSHPGRAYQDLWRISQAMVAGTLVIGGFALALLFWLLTRVLVPLRAVEAQAEAIGKRDFRNRIGLSPIRELNQVTTAMNQMADDLGQLFDGQAKLIQHLRRLNNEDTVTGLNSHRAFDQRLRVEVESEEKASDGVLVLVQLSGFSSVNQHYGRDHGDALLGRIADAVKGFVLEHPGAFAGRRVGAEIAIFIPGVALVDAMHWCRQLISELDLVYQGAAAGESVAIHAGVVQVADSNSATEVLSACDEALRKAQVENGSGCASADSGASGHHGAETWRELIRSALDQQEMELWRQPTVACDGRTVLHWQVLSRLRIEENWVRGGVFVPMAERFGLTAQLDLMVLDKSLKLLSNNAELELSMTLGISSIADEGFRQAFVARLRSAGLYCHRFWVGIPEHAVHHHNSVIGTLVRALRGLGVSVMVDRFGVGGVPFSYLRNLPFQALRIDHSFIHNLPGHDDNRFYLESIINIAHSRGVKVYAAGVETASEWELVRAIGVDGVMGYHVGRPEPQPDIL